VTTLTMPIRPVSERGMHVKGPSTFSRLWSKSATTFALLIFFDLTVATRHLLLGSRLCALALMIILPGLTVVGATRVRLESKVSQLAFVIGMGTFVLMLWAAVSSAVLPSIGVPRPLETWPLTLAVNAICLLALLACPPNVDPILPLLEGRRSRSTILIAIGALLLPLAGLAGAERLNSGRGSLLDLIIWIAVLLVLAGTLYRAPKWTDAQVQIVLFGVSLTLIYLYSYRSNHLFGFDVQQEFQQFSRTFAAGRWTPPSNGNSYAAMLSITALPASLAKVSGISGLYIFKGVFPIFLAWIPPLTYGFARRWFAPFPSAVSAIYLIMLAQFAGELSGISRQEVGLFYFGLLLLVLVDVGLRGYRKNLVSIGVLGALAVSHYSTAYVAFALLAVTWFVYAVVRVVSRWRNDKPFITFVVAISGVALVLIWDVAITSSAHNLTSFVTSMVDQGPSILPHSKGSILTRWLSGNVNPVISPTKYYQLALQATKHEPWVHPYPVSITSHYPASAAPALPSAGLGFNGLASAFGSIGTVVSELFLGLVVFGTLMMVLRNRATSVPREIAVLCTATLGFLAVIRVSGTFGEVYNQDRAQIQAGMVLCISLALACNWFAGRSRRLTTAGTVVALVILGATVPAAGSGLVAELGTGGSPLLTNSGTYYNSAYMTDEEVAAAKWLSSNAGPHPLIWTDQFGELRIWAATPYTAAPQTSLTPATVGQGSWIFATGYNLNGMAYGEIDDKEATYRFPSAFLNRVKTTVYSSPGARVYR
jgi:uncharacterized membrane protein